MTYQYRIIANFFIIAQMPQGVWALLILEVYRKRIGQILSCMRILGPAYSQYLLIQRQHSDIKI